MPILADGVTLKSERQQVPRILLSILDDLNNAIVWMVWNRHSISNFYILFSKTVPSVPIMIDITVTVMFPGFF